MVWITADVHYCAAHHYDPARAAAKDFDPFWEFVAGPAHAGTFAPGVARRARSVPRCGSAACRRPAAESPAEPGLQFFGLLEAEPGTRALTVSFVNTAGTRVFTHQLEAARSSSIR